MIQNLGALATFIQVSRQLSFTKAAKLLHLSQGAVSVQIKQLEAELGFKLFHRRVRKIYLTREGEWLLNEVEPAFKKIMSSIESIRSKRESGRLTVSTLPSFAAKWLIPRITKFQQEYPEMIIRVHTSESRANFIADQIDCAIRFGLGKYSGMNATHLKDEIYFPVCHPNLRDSKHPLKNPEDIQRFTLLHDTRLLEDSNISWGNWAEEMGVTGLDFSRGMHYDQADYAIQAAIAGQGVALGRISLVENDLKNGLLVPLFDQESKSNFSYYFVHPEEYSDSPAIGLFKQWVIKQMTPE